jgi:Holliday junction resolvasome RuvABC endonuclease subunit
MALILAFDQSIARTGWAVYEPPTISTMMIGSFTSRPAKGMTTEEKTAIFCDEIERLFKAHKPSFVIWEAATEIIRSYPKQGKTDLLGQHKVQGVTVNADQLILRDIQGHIRHAARARRIPYEPVNPKTWHAAMLKNGNLNREDSKRKARELCQMLRIPVKNEDQAEAACIAMFGGTCQTFKMLQMQARAA